jgi:hypothetical protein
MDNSDREPKETRVLLGKLGCSEVGRYDHGVRGQLRPQRLGKQRSGSKMLDRDIEEAFNSGSVQVDGQHALHARGLDQIGQKTSAQRLDPAGASVLAGVAEVGNNGGKPGCAGAAARVGEQQELEEIIGDWKASGLSDVNILPTNFGVEFDVELAIGEPLHDDLVQVSS